MSGVHGIAAVVLNYKTWQDAVNCVNDLKAQDHPYKHIVVVENGSGNESAAELTKRFSDDPLVTVLVSDKNLGFARGNNLGIRYAHEKLGYDTVFVVNSDTRIPATLFSEIAKLDVNGVGAVSPTVVLPTGERQVFDANSDDADLLAKTTVINLVKANIASLPVIRKIYGKRAAGRANEPAVGLVPQPKAAVLYGCSYFLTPDFFKFYPMLYPRTFLFGEEINLLICLKRAGLRSIYAETTPMTHIGGRSTGISAAGNVNRFRLKHANRSVVRSLPMYFTKSSEAARKLIEKPLREKRSSK